MSNKANLRRTSNKPQEQSNGLLVEFLGNFFGLITRIFYLLAPIAIAYGVYLLFKELVQKNNFFMVSYRNLTLGLVLIALGVLIYLDKLYFHSTRIHNIIQVLLKKITDLLNLLETIDFDQEVDTRFIKIYYKNQQEFIFNIVKNKNYVNVVEFETNATSIKLETSLPNQKGAKFNLRVIGKPYIKSDGGTYRKFALSFLSEIEGVIVISLIYTLKDDTPYENVGVKLDQEILKENIIHYFIFDSREISSNNQDNILPANNN